MSWHGDFTAEWREIIAAAWPETDDSRMMGKTAAYVNWREAISNGEDNNEGIGLSFPLAVVEAGDYKPEMDYGDANDGYKVRITAIYIAQWQKPASSPNRRYTAVEMEELLLSKFEAMRLAMREDHDTFSVIGQVTCNASVQSPTNQYLAKSHFQGMAVEVYVDCTIVLGDE